LTKDKTNTSNYFVSNLIIRIVGRIKLIDLSGGEGRFLQLKQLESKNLDYSYSMGFLPNGDLIIVAAVYYDGHVELKDYKIFKYSFINKPTNATSWEYSQTHNIHVENLDHFSNSCFIYKTKLFLISEGLMVQWDLLKMAFEMQYNLVVDYRDIRYFDIVINESQTLLALYANRKIEIYSMETGMWISRYG
jgi:hypothetical protein